MPRILEQTEGMSIARRRAADLEGDVFVAVVIEIRERHAVTLVHLACSGGNGHIHE